MKMIKNIFAVGLLMSMTLPLMAQEATFDKQLGDSATVSTDPDCDCYLTGERRSDWVAGTRVKIIQIGTKRFPEGVLVYPVYSWMLPKCLDMSMVENPEVLAPLLQPKKTEVEQAQEAERQAAAKRAAQQKAEEEVRQAQAAAQAKADSAMIAQAKAIEEREAAIANDQKTEGYEQVVEEPKTKPYDRFTIGLRGGAAGLLHNTKGLGKWDCGYDVMLDLQYAHYWTKFGRPVDLGIITGLSVGFARSGVHLDIDSAYTVNTPDGKIDYKLSADRVKEFDGQIQLEIPVLFSMISEKGLFFNVGPKILLPVYTPYNQKITNPNIDAYFQEEGVHVTNEVITGLVTEDQMNTKGTNGNNLKINVMLTGEIGYEWVLKSGNSLALGAYANYGLWNAFKGQTENKSLLDVTAPSATGAAAVDVLSATDTYASKLGYFDAGLKLAYHFNFPKKQKVQKDLE